MKRSWQKLCKSVVTKRCVELTNQQELLMTFLSRWRLKMTLVTWRAWQKLSIAQSYHWGEYISLLLPKSEWHLSSAVGIYSGAGGYSAYRPGLVGLTPSQLREVKKFEEDTSLEHHQFLLAPSISSDVWRIEPCSHSANAKMYIHASDCQYKNDETRNFNHTYRL